MSLKGDGRDSTLFLVDWCLCKHGMPPILRLGEKSFNASSTKKGGGSTSRNLDSTMVHEFTPNGKSST